MTAEADIFKSINIAVLDLQSSHLQTYAHNLKRLARLLENDELAPINNALVGKANLDAFLKTSESSQGGMVGTAELAWPDDPEQVLGLKLLLIRRCAEVERFAEGFSLIFYYSGSGILNNLNAMTRQLIIPFARDYKDYVLHRGVRKAGVIMPKSNKIFIVHGHDGEARETVARYLTTLDFRPIILHEQANRGRTVIEKVEAESDVGFAVVLLTPDDEGCMKGGKPESRARQNVLLELGYFLGRLGRANVCALRRGAVEIPSDFAGVIWEEMDAAGGWKRALGRELEAAGHPIDWNKAMRS